MDAGTYLPMWERQISSMKKKKVVENFLKKWRLILFIIFIQIPKKKCVKKYSTIFPNQIIFLPPANC